MICSHGQKLILSSAHTDCNTQQIHKLVQVLVLVPYRRFSHWLINTTRASPCLVTFTRHMFSLCCLFYLIWARSHCIFYIIFCFWCYDEVVECKTTCVHKSISNIKLMYILYTMSTFIYSCYKQFALYVLKRWNMTNSTNELFCNTNHYTYKNVCVICFLLIQGTQK